MVTAEELAIRFTYHKPTESQIERCGIIREALRTVATMVVDLTPESREQAMALTKLEEAMYWSAAALVRRERDDPQITQMGKQKNQSA
jgi:hypothetical protein